MKVAIIGVTGFIGGYFLKEYSGHFDEVRCLVRSRMENVDENIIRFEGSLKDKEVIRQMTLGVDVVVHAGFDPLYRENKLGLEILLECMIENNISKLVYLSSYVVYDVFHSPNLNESTPFSKLSDIYTNEKKELEKIFLMFSQTNPSICIINLQPTIVYGLGGNWTNSLLTSAKHSNVKIPNKGNYLCPIIYVRDVTSGMFNSVMLSSETPKGLHSIILNSMEDVKWSEFYKSHFEFLKEIGKTTECTPTIIEGYKGSFGNNWISNSLLSIIYFGFLNSFFNFLLIFLKRRLYKKKQLDPILNSDRLTKSFELLGLYKFIQSADSRIDDSKARFFLDFTPAFSLSKGLNDMINIYKNNEQQM